jgi:hypothetical protein
MGFEATKQLLDTLLNDIQTGKAQLPEFQRNWVWDDQRIKDLLVSVIRKHPIGSVMLLESGNNNARFKYRPVEGTSFTDTVKPQIMILDGQQRLTSLFQVLKSGHVVQTVNDRKQVIKRWYYLDLNKLLAAPDKHYDNLVDWDELLVSVPEDRLVRNFRNEVIHDYSSREKECKAGMFPLTIALNEEDKLYWQAEFLKHNNTIEQWLLVFERVIKPIQQYNVPVIQLDQDESKEAICKVFEKVNTGGVALDVFELLTASFAAEDFDLREDWRLRSVALKPHRVLESVTKTDFLLSIALLVTFDQRQQDIAAKKRPDEVRGVSCKRKSILDLTPALYQTWADKVEAGFIQAAQFLFDQYVFTARDLPYRTQLVPLAAIFAWLGQDLVAGTTKKLVRWYWSGIFGELYGSATETRFAKDMTEILAWLEAGPEPGTITECNFSATRLLSLTTRNSAAYKGIYALLMRDGGFDFLEGKPINSQVYFEAAIDIHHIFPKAWCERHGIDKKQSESVVNKTPIAARTNRMIGDSAPSVYTEKIAASAKISSLEMDQLLKSHAIDPELLREDDFSGFFAARMEVLISRIEMVIEKKISRENLNLSEGIVALEDDYE